MKDWIIDRLCALTVALVAGYLTWVLFFGITIIKEGHRNVATIIWDAVYPFLIG